MKKIIVPEKKNGVLCRGKNNYTPPGPKGDEVGGKKSPKGNQKQKSEGTRKSGERQGGRYGEMLLKQGQGVITELGGPQVTKDHSALGRRRVSPKKGNRPLDQGEMNKVGMRKGGQ